MKRLLLFFALLPLMLQGQHYVVRHYSVEDGLIQNTVMAIMQDKQGFMWFGTWD
jgi:ligand-binding sensor domain-containing protein